MPPSTATGNCTWPRWWRLHSDSFVMPGYGSSCRSHCCDIQTGVMVSGDVGCAATSAKRFSAGSAPDMTALVENADMLRTRFLLLVLRIVRNVRSLRSVILVGSAPAFCCWVCELCESCELWFVRFLGWFQSSDSSHTSHVKREQLQSEQSSHSSRCSQDSLCWLPGLLAQASKP